MVSAPTDPGTEVKLILTPAKVANAGRTKHKAALDFTTEEIDQLWGVNLYGSFYTARCAARAFIKQGVRGSVVFTASMASHRPNKVLSPYPLTQWKGD